MWKDKTVTSASQDSSTWKKATGSDVFHVFALVTRRFAPVQRTTLGPVYQRTFPEVSADGLRYL